MPPTDKEKGRPQQVFISYAANDQSVARRIADALRGAGLSVWFDEWVLLPGDSISQRIDEGLQASDLLLVLLSPSSVESRWVQEELNATLSLELRTRGVTVVPALIEDCEMPPLLATRQYLDLRGDLEGGVQKLIEQLGVAPEIEFSRLDPRSFEKLIADLLVELGFSVELRRPSRDSGFDFLATFTSNDPFGTERRESWLVEAKLYRDQRVSLQALRQMVGYMVTVAGSHRGLVVTSSQLTSVASKFLEEITEKSGRELRVIDGTELRALLSRHPQLVERYFGKGAEG